MNAHSLTTNPAIPIAVIALLGLAIFCNYLALLGSVPLRMQVDPRVIIKLAPQDKAIASTAAFAAMIPAFLVNPIAILGCGLAGFAYLGAQGFAGHRARAVSDEGPVPPPIGARYHLGEIGAVISCITIGFLIQSM